MVYAGSVNQYRDVFVAQLIVACLLLPASHTVVASQTVVMQINLKPHVLHPYYAGAPVANLAAGC